MSKKRKLPLQAEDESPVVPCDQQPQGFPSPRVWGAAGASLDRVDSNTKRLLLLPHDDMVLAHEQLHRDLLAKLAAVPREVYITLTAQEVYNLLTEGTDNVQTP